MQSGGTQFSLESLMTPNFVFFIVTLAIIGYLYQTRMILGRESEVKSQSANLFDKQMYLEIGFMILIGFCMYIFNNNENTNRVSDRSISQLKEQKDQFNLRKTVFNFEPQTYRIILKLSDANPSAPAETVTRALRKAGIKFEVEKIEQFNNESALKNLSNKRSKF